MPMYLIEPPLQRVKLKQLRPTQMTVGFKEVQRKHDKWARKSEKKRADFISEMIFPTVIGPDGQLYILDHHHEAVALLQERSQEVQSGLVKDLSTLTQEAFWVFLDHYSWSHCYDVNGRRQPAKQMPKRFEDLADDPYRSLASDVQKRGGFAKSEEPILEFLWANHFRDHIGGATLKSNPKKATSEALALAKSKQSRYLPGWSGKE